MERDLVAEFQTLVNTVIAPTLKEFGFKKYNLNFNRKIDGIVQCLNIQKSQYINENRISFIINIGIYNSQVFKVSKDRTEEPKIVTVDNCLVWGRSGHFTTNGDYWYDLNLDNDYKSVSNLVEEELKNKIIPIFEKLQTLKSLIDLVRIDFINRPFRLIANIDNVTVLELEHGNFERGQDMLIGLYKTAIIPKSTKHTTVYPDGKEEVRWSEPSINEFYINKLIRIGKNYGIELSNSQT